MIKTEIAKGRIERGDYDRPCVIDRVVERVLEDLALDDTEDQERLLLDAEGWIE